MNAYCDYTPCKGRLRGKASGRGRPRLSGQALKSPLPGGNFQELAPHFYLFVQIINFIDRQPHLCINPAAMAYLSCMYERRRLPGREFRTTLFTCIFAKKQKNNASLEVTFALLTRPGNKCQASVGHRVKMVLWCSTANDNVRKNGQMLADLILDPLFSLPNRISFRRRH